VLTRNSLPGPPFWSTDSQADDKAAAGDTAAIWKSQCRCEI
jgi:hypothetical protein